MDFGFREGLLRDGVQRTSDNKLEAVLNNWIETHCSEVSWENLIQVLTELEFLDTVQDVRSFLQRDTGIMEHNFTSTYHTYLNKSHTHFFSLWRTTSSVFGGYNS